MNRVLKDAELTFAMCIFIQSEWNINKHGGMLKANS